MDSERDKFLTEAMGECWHEDNLEWTHCQEENCRSDFPRPCYSDWPGFGKLWEWAQRQKWYKSTELLVYLWQQVSILRYGNTKYRVEMTGSGIPAYFIHPDHFADALYKFLKEKNL